MKTTLAACALALAATIASAPANTLSGPVQGSSLQNATSNVEQVYVARRTAVRRGPAGNVAVRRTTVVRPGGWARPSWYRWGPGGAVAAGAALGFVAAGVAVAYAGTPPAPGYCWYYTDATRRQGFWDVCP